MPAYPQPHEGVTGTARDEPWLRLNDDALAVRGLIIALVNHLDDATLVGDPAPVVKRMGARIRNPRVGDLVVETTARFPMRGPDRRVNGFGILLTHRDEWWTSDEEWEEELAAEREALGDPDYAYPRLVDHAWYIQYGPEPADVCRWTNCSFITVPTDPETFSEPAGTIDADGRTVFTRDSLIRGLADSGFQLREPR